MYCRSFFRKFDKDKIKLLYSWKVVILGCAADLSFENDDNVDKYLENIIL
jgi:hypothetical protein